jgi:hypothetical protein
MNYLKKMNGERSGFRGSKVQRFKKLSVESRTDNNEYRISNNEYQSLKTEK